MIDPHANYRPIAADAGLPASIGLLESIGPEHLLTMTVTTAAGEAWKADGTDHQRIVVVELEGRYNRTDVPGFSKAILEEEAAAILADNVTHSLGALTARRLAIVNLDDVELLVARALAGSSPGKLNILGAPRFVGHARKLLERELAR